MNRNFLLLMLHKLTCSLFILCTISSSCFRSSNLSFLASFFAFFPFPGAGACSTRGVAAALSLAFRPYWQTNAKFKGLDNNVECYMYSVKYLTNAYIVSPWMLCVKKKCLWDKGTKHDTVINAFGEQGWQNIKGGYIGYICVLIQSLTNRDIAITCM